MPVGWVTPVLGSLQELPGAQRELASILPFEDCTTATWCLTYPTGWDGEGGVQDHGRGARQHLRSFPVATGERAMALIQDMGEWLGRYMHCPVVGAAGILAAWGAGGLRSAVKPLKISCFPQWLCLAEQEFLAGAVLRGSPGSLLAVSQGGEGPCRIMGMERGIITVSRPTKTLAEDITQTAGRGQPGPLGV